MATITSAGIGSGLDVETIITKLVAIERQPITKLQTAAGQLQTQISDYGKIQGLMSTMRDAASKLTSSDTWNSTVGSSSNSAAVSVTAGTASPTGSYSVAVGALAASQTLVVGTTLPASTAALGQGTVHIDIGTWGAGQSSFTPKTGSTGVDITIAATDTLADIRDKINAAGAGVTASIVTDASGARLTMRSTQSGLENAFRVSVVDGDGNNTDASGLSALAYDPSSGVASMTQTIAAANASATINGLSISSPSNTLTNVLDGLTLKLGQVTTAPIDVTVDPNTETIKKAITDFATAYNTLNSTLRDLTKYDAGSKTAGELQGDRTAVGLQNQLRSLLGGSSGASGVFGRLADVGLNPQKDGSLQVNDAKLSSALGNLPELKKFFANASATTDTSTDGFATRFRVYGDAVLGFDGALAARTSSLQTTVSKNQKQQSELDDRATAYEARLRQQYTALDSRLASINALSAYVTNQIAAWNKRSP